MNYISIKLLLKNFFLIKKRKARTRQLWILGDYNWALYFFWPRNVACGILVTYQGLNRGLAVKVHSPNHWTTRELPGLSVEPSLHCPCWWWQPQIHILLKLLPSRQEWASFPQLHYNILDKGLKRLGLIHVCIRAEYCNGVGGGDGARLTQCGLHGRPCGQGAEAVTGRIGGGHWTKTAVALQKQNVSCRCSVDFD